MLVVSVDRGPSNQTWVLGWAARAAADGTQPKQAARDVSTYRPGPTQVAQLQASRCRALRAVAAGARGSMQMGAIGR
eukprot:5681104-Prymnesium_polylepis.1